MKKTTRKFAAFLLSLAMVASTAVMPTVSAAPVPVLSENFEDGTDGASMNGFNGWKSTVEASGSYVLDAAATIADEDGNKTFLYTKTSGTDNSQDVSAGKAFDTPFSGGVLSTTIRIRHNGGLSDAIVMLSGSKYGDEAKNGWLNTVFDFSGKRIYFGGSTWVTPFTFTVGQWYTFEIAVDTDTQEYALLKDGQFLIPFTDCGGTNSNATLGKTVSSISFKSTRNKAVAEDGGSFSVDDILIVKKTLADIDAEALSLPAETAGEAITLPATGALGSSVTWTSSDTDIISNGGAVTLPSFTERVTLTATVQNGSSMAQRKFIVKVLDADTYLDEDFESPQFTSLPITAGATVEGWNGYTTNAGNSSYTIDTKFDVKTADDDAKNHVLSILRTGTPSGNSSYITLTKNFKAPVGETGKYSVSFRYKKVTSSLGRTSVFLKDDAGKTETFTIYPSKGCIDLSGGSNTRYQLYVNGSQTTSYLPSGWYDFEFVFDNDAKTLSVYQDGYTIVENFAYTNSDMGAISKIQFYNTRNEGTLGQEVYFDDLSVIKLTDEGICQKAIAEAGKGLDGMVTRSDITLLTNGYGGAELSWQSSDPAVISVDGAVTPAEETKDVTLTVTATKGGTTLSRAYTVSVLGENTFDAAVETPIFEETFNKMNTGVTLNGQGDWRATEGAILSGTEQDAHVTVETVDGSNVLQYTKTTATANSPDVLASRAIGTNSSGIISTKFRAKRTAGVKQFIVALNGSRYDDESASGWTNVVFDASGSRIYICNSSIVTAYAFTADTWHSFEILYNTDDKKIAVYQGNTCLIPFSDTTGITNGNLGKTYSALTFKADRKAGVSATEGGTFYIDDISVAGVPEALLASKSVKLTKASDGVNYVLPTTGEFGTKIRWTSSDPSVISETGVVTPADETKTVTLTATVSKNYLVATRVFNVKVIDAHTYFADDFEAGEDSRFVCTPSADVVGYNGWTTNSGSSSYTIDTLYSIKSDSGNRVLSNTRTGAPSSKSSYITIRRAFDRVASSGLISVRFRYKKVTTALGRTQVMLRDSAGQSELFVIYPVNACVDLDNKNTNRKYMFEKTSGSTLPVGWYEFEAIFDPANRKYSLYHDGYTLVEDFPYQNENMGTDLAGIAFYGVRNEGALGQEFYIDDIKVSDFTDAQAAEKALRDAKKVIGDGVLTGNVTLPTTGLGGASISWESSNTAAIEKDGTVHVGAQSQYATLTGTANCGGATAQKAYKVKIQGLDEILYDDFDFPAADVGTELNGYNGWSMTTGDLTEYTLDTVAAIATVGDNKALNISRSNCTGNSADVTFKKSFNPILGGKVNLSFKLMRENENARGFNVKIGGTWLCFDFPNNRVLPGNHEFANITIPAFTVGEWKDIVISANIDSRTFDLYVGGEKVCANAALPNCTGIEDTLVFCANRTNNAAGASFYIDNIEIKNELIYSMAVCGVEFKDASGNPYPTRVNGGEVSAVTVTAKQPSTGFAVAVRVTDAYGNCTAIGYGKTEDAVDTGKVATVHLTGVRLPDENAENATIKVLVLKDMATLMPVAAPFTYDRAATDKITFFMCGDSMTANYSAQKYPMTGVGQVIGNYFDSDKVQVRNLAVGGRSALSFYNENRLQNVLKDVKVGDYVFIMFGHNDQSADVDRHTEPYGTYQQYLKRLISMARSRGAIPVLMTPITRRVFTDGELDLNVMGEYPAAMRQLANDYSVMLIDNTAYSQTTVSALGEEGSKNFYMYIEPNDPRYAEDSAFDASDFKTITEVHVDNTHMTTMGANTMASFMKDELVRQGAGISAYVAN